MTSCGKVSFPEGLEADLILISREEDEGNTEYIPVIVELKRINNREVRREVLAQLLEYMTAIYLHPEQVIQTCLNKNKEINLDIENLKKNIEERRIRGIILSERIPEIVKKTIELLNEELENLELYGVEFKQLCSNDGKYHVIVPVLIGATTEAERKKKKMRILWTYEDLRQVYSSIEDELLRRRLLDLLEWAYAKRVLKEYKTNEPRFRIFQDIVTVEKSGKLYVKFGKNHESKLPKPKRQKLLEELQKLGMISPDIKDADSVKDGKYTSRSIAELTENEFKRLKELFEDLFLSS